MIKGNCFNQLSYFNQLVGVKPVRGLVHYHQFGLMDNGLRYANALPVTAR